MGEGLRETPLHALHVALGAKMVPFAGYDMPVQYPMGILKEHLHTRAAAGLFDVSHMGQVAVRARSGDIADAARALEALVPVDVVGLAPGRQRYAFFTDDAGGILDDLMVANRGDHLLLVVNAACRDADLAHLQAGLAGVRRRAAGAGADRAAGAAGGGGARRSSRRTWRGCGSWRCGRWSSAACRRWSRGRDIPARTGSRSRWRSGTRWRWRSASWRADEVAPVGLGARDSLRLEAGLCLYGSDIDRTTTPVEAGLEWAIQPARRTGRRAGRGVSGGGRHPRADRVGGVAAAGGAPAGGAGADAARDGALRRRGEGRRGDLGRVRAEPRPAGGDGLRGDREGGAGDPAGGASCAGRCCR